MSRFKKIILLGFVSSLALTMIACSDNSEETAEKPNGDHVWKTQTNALQSAKDMANKMEESLKQQQEKMDEKN